MNKVIISVLQLIIIALICSCQQQAQDDLDEFAISGNIKINNQWQNKIYLSKIQSMSTFFIASPAFIVDTATIHDDGTFEFDLDSLPDEPTFYRLNITKKGSPGASIIFGGKDENFIFLLLDRNSNITIAADANNLTKSYRVEGSLDNLLIKELRTIRERSYAQADKIRERLQELEGMANINKDSIIEAMKIGLTNTLIENNKSIEEFIDTAQNPLVSILATLYYDYNDDLNDDLEYFETLDTRFQEDLPHSKYAEQFHQRIVEFKTVLPVGSKVPEIILNDTSGYPINLSSLFNKNKLILLDFWASWCSPCREENKYTTLPLYKQYHEKGFEIYGVSFDTDKQSWIKSINEDNILWIQVSDLKGKHKSPIASDYKINSLPTTFLIDNNGNIIAKGKRGFELKDFIDEFFDKI